MDRRPNLIVVIADTLRADYLGCYGNPCVRTPNIDAFAADAVMFTEAYPEALPTIVHRRALHTGRRVFPFRTYRPLPWDIVSLPGWQPMENEEDTLAENLAAAGYYTGFVTDTLPYFAPGMNFTRGFWQWEFVRGQQQDRWKSPATVTRDQLRRYGDPDTLLARFPDGLQLRHIANTAHVRGEADRTTARVFHWAQEFIEDNRSLEPFYLLVDSFAPHEPWEAPPSYLEQYGDPDYRGRIVVVPRYGPMDGQLTESELAQMRAHYCGLVSLVDAWFGRFLDRLKQRDLYDGSLIVFTSDHGTNFADNPRRIVGKPTHAMYPAVMRTPLLIHFPGGEGAGRQFHQLVSNTDLVATLYAASGVARRMGRRLQIDGQDLHALLRGSGWEERPYLTCRYGDDLWYRDDRWWILFKHDGAAAELFDLTADPGCATNLVDRGAASLLGRAWNRGGGGNGRNHARPSIAQAWQRVLADAGGTIPLHPRPLRTDAIGQRS